MLKQSEKATPLACASVPNHVGIIMDGNGRWAKARGWMRGVGHKEGLKAARKVVEAASDAGIGYLSLFTLSTENIRKRPASEISLLMDLTVRYLHEEMPFFCKNRIRVVHSGRNDNLPLKVRNELERCRIKTAAFKGLTVNLAFNYGGRDEILRGFGSMIRDLAAEGASAEEIAETLKAMDESDFSSWLDVPDLPDMDLLIRTGGERRISNFLLWQSAYAELLFSDTLWPDWSGLELGAAIREFSTRNRRFGGLDQTSGSVSGPMDIAV